MKQTKKDNEKAIATNKDEYIIKKQITVPNRKPRVVKAISKNVIKENTGDNIEQETFSIRFNELLEEKGYTQKNFSKDTGISTGSISKFRNGVSIPKRDTLEIISNMLDVSSNYLLGKSDVTEYNLEDINKKTGLSQKAIEQLYKLQHDYSVLEDINIDITEKRKTSKTYMDELTILSLMIEDNANLIDLLCYIKQYINKCKDLENFEKSYKKKKDKNIYSKIEDTKKEIKFLKFSALEILSNSMENIKKGFEENWM